MYTYNVKLFSLKKEGNLVTWINLEDIWLTEVNQSQKNKYYMDLDKVEQSNSQKQKEFGLPGVRGREAGGVVV